MEIIKANEPRPKPTLKTENNIINIQTQYKSKSKKTPFDLDQIEERKSQFKGYQEPRNATLLP